MIKKNNTALIMNKGFIRSIISYFKVVIKDLHVCYVIDLEVNLQTQHIFGIIFKIVI